MLKPRLLLLISAMALTLSVPVYAEAPATKALTLDQIMADPDWIGTPVERVWWAHDSQSVLFTRKRDGQPIRDIYRQALDQSQAVAQSGEQQADLDAPMILNATRTHAAFIRNQDVFLRNVKTHKLQQITRGVNGVNAVQFADNGADLQYRVGTDWYGWSASQALTYPLAILRAEKSPEARSEPDRLKDLQLRLISTLAREKAQRDELREHAKTERLADATRAAEPVFLGDGVSIESSRISPAGDYLTVVTQRKSAPTGRAGKMPKYVTESGYEEVEDVRTRVGLNPPLPHALHLVDLRDNSMRTLDLANLPGINQDPLADLRKLAGQEALQGNRPVRVDSAEWNTAGTQVAVMLRAVDNKDRWIATIDLKAGLLKPAHRLTDPGWINWSFNEFGWLPDGNTLWLLSEESGYSHLYTVQPGKKAQQITKGQWEVSNVEFSADGNTAYVLCNRKWPGDYEVCEVDRRKKSVSEITDVDGVEDFSLSPDGSAIALRWSAHHTPPQLATLRLADKKFTRHTDTRSAAFKAQDWMAPEIVQVPSQHGAGVIWGKLYKPRDMQPDKKYPIALFVHGAGYLQNVHARYPAYFREQMFHQMLTEHGYVVLDLDYRASQGYGRDWRTAIYRQMGHPELEDYLDGLDWLVDTQHGDRSRVGIYGGSYGGFMAFMAMFREPDVFHAGAALRPVTDWTSYNHEYTSNILNTPDIDPEAYKKSSPIEYAQNLKGHLLISHGMMDDNVFYQDSVRLAQRLIEMKKHNWELASYPLERHGYQHPESWYDQYRRIFELFERALK